MEGAAHHNPTIPPRSRYFLIDDLPAISAAFDVADITPSTSNQETK